MKPFSIIIADNDEDDQFLIRDAFDSVRPGLKIVTANNGANLLNILNDNHANGVDVPDFIILDVNMRLVDGYETLSRLKTEPTLKSIPVFMLSTSISPEKIQFLKNMGAIAYFTKPSSIKGYQEIVETIFSYFKG